MKNYLVKTLFRVGDPNWHILDRSRETDLYEKYQDLHILSLGTYKQHLRGQWEYRFLGGAVDHINQAFEKTFWYIHDLWHSEPCNILYTDPDTMAVRDIDLWDKFTHFSMFNHTDPRSFNTPNRWGRSFSHFFNAGVRYFPASMRPEIWKIGAGMAREWDHTTYDTEQIILNAMLWDQTISTESVFRPQLNWMAMNLRQLTQPIVEWHDRWNQCSHKEAAILHFCSSRGAAETKAIMQELLEQHDLHMKKLQAAATS